MHNSKVISEYKSNNNNNSKKTEAQIVSIHVRGQRVIPV